MTDVMFTHDPLSKTVTWNGLGQNQAGSPFKIDHTDCSVHIFGTFDGATCLLEGSNDPRAELGNPSQTSASWFPLVDNGDQPISIATTADGRVIAQSPTFIRPRTTGGDGSTNLQCIISRKGRG